MEFGIATYGLGYLAGVLSTLSPCVFPLIPIVLAGAVSVHRFGPLALTAGLAFSFAVTGMFVAAIGAAIGLDSERFRQIAAGLLVGFGIILMSGALQMRFANAVAGIGDAGHLLLARIQINGLSGQLLLGFLLGIVWAPCVGPTLGAASTLASQGKDLPQAALMMMLFGVGAGTPLLALGALSRARLLTWRKKQQSAGVWGKPLLGGGMAMLGLFTLTGFDKVVEMWLIEISPEWLTELATRF